MIVYASRTGNVQSIVGKLGLPAIAIDQAISITKPFLLFTYTDGLGSVPLVVENYMQQNHMLCKGIIVSGNRNFGHSMFGRAGDLLANYYQLPLIAKLDLRGTTADYEQIKQFYNSIWNEAR
ncbi:class Ib ribonucleoside-diphosphate reductase assembly flavoprotein NrdI [Solibacillus daqui]|uniref:class Ib ribonucleoside-diphosphate reductase assembly flavoprotein NrdI n=1 Tax=Solibacillus daqui TaxID=2912187 RepID=UPI002366E4DA|nr:class Ib ribonucleoside-diphosphate reductase assembly flavoprotein NrdI [Solibacillus daqui]